MLSIHACQITCRYHSLKAAKSTKMVTDPRALNTAHSRLLLAAAELATRVPHFRVVTLREARDETVCVRLVCESMRSINAVIFSHHDSATLQGGVESARHCSTLAFCAARKCIAYAH